MVHARVLDSLFGIPKSIAVAQVSDCVPCTENFIPKMAASGPFLLRAPACSAIISGTAPIAAPMK